jgi:hypothetical protein
MPTVFLLGVLTPSVFLTHSDRNSSFFFYLFFHSHRFFGPHARCYYKRPWMVNTLRTFPSNQSCFKTTWLPSSEEQRCWCSHGKHLPPSITLLVIWQLFGFILLLKFAIRTLNPYHSSFTCFSIYSWEILTATLYEAPSSATIKRPWWTQYIPSNQNWFKPKMASFIGRTTMLMLVLLFPTTTCDALERKFVAIRNDLDGGKKPTRVQSMLVEYKINWHWSASI